MKTRQRREWQEGWGWGGGGGAEIEGVNPLGHRVSIRLWLDTSSLANQVGEHVYSGVGNKV